MATKSTSSKPSGISNVINVYKAVAGNAVKAITGKDNSWASPITATTSSKTLNKGLEVVANNPFTTAAVVAGGITAARNAPAIATAIKSSFAKGSAVVATQTATKAAASSLPSWIVPASLGAGAALTLSGMGRSAPQDVTQNSQPSIFTDNRQKNIQYSPQDNRQYNSSKVNTDARQWNTAEESPYARVGGNPQLDYAFEPSQIPSQQLRQEPTFSTPVNQSAGQYAEPTQSSGTNWLMLAAVGLGAYMLGGRR